MSLFLCFFQIVWTAVRGSGYKADIALDSVVIETGSCGGVCCTWGEWTPWSACVSGRKSRTRSKYKGPGCQTCKGTDNHFHGVACCDTPIDCEWAAWSQWSACTSNTQTRTRVKRRLASCGGQDCIGLGHSSTTCCIPVDCQWGVWSSWGECSANSKNRSRRKQKSASCGGSDCPGNTIDTEQCVPDHPGDPG